VQHASDEEVKLAQELLAGNAGAFERFVQVFQSKVFQYSYLMCGHREDAEEVAQETLMRVFENFDQLREPERVKPWVFRIARNNCLMKRRRSIFAPAEELSIDELRPDSSGEGTVRRFEPVDAGERPDAHAERRQLRAVLDEAIRELPPIYRAVVLLRDVEEVSTEEAAEILDVSTDVVKTRLRRARMALREALEDQLAASAEGAIEA
jgi:RNA polymerase sigma-70 factor, ECF subfamily